MTTFWRGAFEDARAAARVPRRGAGTALELLLYEAEGPECELPDGLRERYPGAVRLRGPARRRELRLDARRRRRDPRRRAGERLIADENDDDRFVMGLLRASADVVLIGSGTMLASPNGLWTAESTYPDSPSEWAELRRRLGKPELPRSRW